MIRVESKFVDRGATNFDSIAGHSAVLTIAARVHLTAFDGNHLSGHKFPIVNYLLWPLITFCGRPRPFPDMLT